MERKNVYIERIEDREEYCARDDFGYNCQNTPHNCTECPVMRFLYYDLTNNVLADESVAKLKRMVEESEVFSGKYDNAKSLYDVWPVIYAIRKAYYDCFVLRGCLPAGAIDACRQRFMKWIAEHGTYQGVPAGEAIVKIALHEIFAGQWLARDAFNRDKVLLIEDSGIYKPAVFSDAGDGIRHLSNVIKREFKKITANKYGCLVCVDFQEDRLSGKSAFSISVHAEPEGGWTRELYEDWEKRDQIRRLSYDLTRVVAKWASTDRNRYFDSVIKMCPNIKLTATDEVYPKDPNHPIYSESDEEWEE